MCNFCRQEASTFKRLDAYAAFARSIGAEVRGDSINVTRAQGEQLKAWWEQQEANGWQGVG